jgi:hypothetical protein
MGTVIYSQAREKQTFAFLPCLLVKFAVFPSFGFDEPYVVFIPGATVNLAFGQEGTPLIKRFWRSYDPNQSTYWKEKALGVRWLRTPRAILP